MSIVRFACLLLILIAGLQVAVPSQAAPANEADIDPAVIYYSRTYHVSTEEAQLRLSKEGYIAEIGRRIETSSPETFAGIYIEHQPVYRVVVRFVGDAKAQLEKYTQDPLFVPMSAPRSLEVMRAAQEDMVEQLRKNGIEYLSQIDLRNSEVVLFVRDPARVMREFALALKVSPFIRVRKTNGFIDTTAISGGRRVNSTGGSAIPSCTTGFNVFDSNRELGITTAGHCDNSMKYAPTGTRLIWQDEHDMGSLDIQWHKQRISQSAPPQQQINSIDLIGGPTSTLEITSVTPSSGYTAGKVVCKSGAFGYYKCGVITNMDSVSVYNGEEAHYIQVHDLNNDVMSEFGDSGGPVFRNNSAYGVIHGRGDTGTPYVNDMFYMPIERLSSLGVSVLTEPFEITSIPDVSGPNGVIPIAVNFRGVPRFPVTVTIEPVTCPPPWQCFPASGQYTTNQPSPLMVGWSCDNDGSLPTTQFTVRTTLQDASLILPPSVEHHVTCIAPLASKSRPKRPMGRAGGVILDQPRH